MSAATIDACPSDRLPLAPLLEVLPIDRELAAAIQGRGGFDHQWGLIGQAADQLGITRRHMHRLAAEGLSVEQADRYAVRGGMHPLAVWGDAWISAIGGDA